MRRVSSKDDVFVSAADLFLMLTTLFLALALRAVSGARAGDREKLEMPVVGASTGTSSKPEHHFTVRPAVTDDGTCHLDVLDAPESLKPELGRTITGKCSSSGFQGKPETPPADLMTIAKQLPWDRRIAVVQCPRSTSERAADSDAALLVCAKAQWMLATAGFRPFVGVEQKPQ